MKFCVNTKWKVIISLFNIPILFEYYQSFKLQFQSYFLFFLTKDYPCKNPLNIPYAIPIFNNVSNATPTFTKDICKRKTSKWLIRNATNGKDEDDGIRYIEGCSFSYECGPTQKGVDTCLSVNGENCTGKQFFTCKINEARDDSSKIGDWGIPDKTKCQPSP